MHKVNALDRQTLWVQKTVAPCQWNKANVNKPDTLETFRKMSCYSFPYIICHMTPQLNLLLQRKKKVHQAVVSMRFGQRQTTRQKGVRDGTVLASFLLRRKWLPTASWPGVRAHPARSQDPECAQMRTKTQLQVIINGNRKLEKTVPSYANTTVLLSAFVCPAGGLYSSFHNDPVCFFPSFSHITNRHAKCKSAHILIPFRQNTGTTTILSFTIISTMTIIHSPSVLFTQKIAIWILLCIGSALSELVTRQTVCFKNIRLLGRVSWGVGMDKQPCTYLL